MLNHAMRVLAFEMDTESWGIAAGVAVAALVMVWFGARFWLVSTRPAAIGDVKTPNVDRLNRSALEHMAEETVEQDEAETAALEEEDSPADLKGIVGQEGDGKNKV